MTRESNKMTIDVETQIILFMMQNNYTKEQIAKAAENIDTIKYRFLKGQTIPEILERLSI